MFSKIWLKTCYTNPRINFDEEDLHSTDNESDIEADVEVDSEADAEAHLEVQYNHKLVEYCHGEFLRIVVNSLEAYHHQNLPISYFKLHISFSDQTDCGV